MNGSRRMQFNINVVNDSKIGYGILSDFNTKLYRLMLFFSAISHIRPLVFPMIWVNEVNISDSLFFV